MAHTYSHLFGLACTGLRFFTVYGPWGRPDMALFLFTKAILADEPISNLDPQLSKEIMDLLLDLSARSGKTLVSSLHAIEFALSHYDRIIGLQSGRILFDSAANTVTESMIKSLYQSRN